MGDRRRQSQGDVTLLLPPGSAADVPPKELNRRRAASVTAFFLIAICSLLLLLSQSPAVWNTTCEDASNAASFPIQRYNTDQDREAAVLLKYGGGPVAQRTENHSAPSLPPSTNEDRLLQHAAKEGIDITDKVVSVATNLTTPQHKSPQSSSVKSQTSSSMLEGTSEANAQKKGGPIFGTPVPGESHIIFVETSCAFNDTPRNVSYDSESGLRLSPRAACALEAAARTHPDRRVYLLHTCPVRREALEPGRAPAYALAALSLPNARLWQQRYKEFFPGSPLERWLESGALRRSVYPVVHAADVLRFVVLWKYGGTYLDTDVLMLRSLGNTSDFACPESEQQVSVGAMDMTFHDAGRRLAELCLDEERLNYDPNQWGHNGPGAITRAMQKMCKVNKVTEMTPEHCGGYKLLPPSAFYPIHYSYWRRFFKEEGAEQTLAEVRGSIGVHVWNALSHDEPVHTHSKQPYAQLARQVCPSVVAALNGTM